MESHIGVGIGRYIEKEFDNAKESLWLISPILTRNVAKKIIAIANKGVKIRILTTPRINPESEYANIMIKKFVLDQTKSSSQNVSVDQKIADHKDIPMIHVKLYIIDKKIAIIGSANLGEKHFWEYAEYICIFNEPEIVKKTIFDFEELWSSCRNYDLQISENKVKLKNILRSLARNTKRIQNKWAL